MNIVTVAKYPVVLSFVNHINIDKKQLKTVKTVKTAWFIIIIISDIFNVSENN